jgi:hypothetical protein
MHFSDFVNPTRDVRAWDNFRELSFGHKAATVVISVLAAIAFLGYGGFVAFRALSYEFRTLELDGKDPMAQQASKVDKQAKEHLVPKKQSTGRDPSLLPTKSNSPVVKQKPVATMKPRPPTDKMVDWKQFIYRNLSKDLEAMGLTFGGAEERGDCFFDAVAQLITIKTGLPHTKQMIRQSIQEHLSTYKGDRYSKLLNGNVEEHSYKDFCEKIGICAEDTSAPIWGNNVTAQAVADIYGIVVRVHRLTVVQLSLFESMDDTYSAFEKHRYTIGGNEIIVEICSKMDEENAQVFKPESGATKGVIQLACAERGPWGHFVPVVEL